MALPFMLTDESLTVQFTDGSCKTISARSPHFKGIVSAIKSDDSESNIRVLFDLAEAVKTFSDGNVMIRNDEVIYNGQVIKNSVSSRILKFMSEGLPWQPLARFLENLMANPSKRAVDYLYNFLEYGNLAITDDGCFLAYKAVRNDFRDKHSGKFLNTPGSILQMERNQVCDNPDMGCSYGFHLGTLEYVRGFACGYGEHSGDKIVIVKTNPADVVSVPHDCAYQKVRTAKYEVLREYTGPLPEYEGCSCDALQEIDADDQEFEGMHVTVKMYNPEQFQEKYTLTTYTKDGHKVSEYTCDSYEDEQLWHKAEAAIDAELSIKVVDQDGVDLTDDVANELA